jgi:predicted transcriptional regulator
VRDRCRVDRERLMLVSIRPRYVGDILCGTKTVELRRIRPQIATGQLVAIYATSPVSAVVATCRVTKVEVAQPPVVKRSTLTAAAITGEEFDQYFRGSPQAVAIHLDAVTPLDEVITLQELRLHRRTYNPPQTWHFFDDIELRDLLGNHSSQTQLSTMLLGHAR